MDKQTPHIWVLTDGKIGDRVQCIGIAERLTSNFEERVVAPKAPWTWFMPTGPIPFCDAPSQPDSPIAPPYPDVVIASGRRAVAYLRVIKRHSPKTITVFLKNPRNPFLKIDLTWAPVHDRLKQAPDLVQTLTSPHGITDDKISAAKLVAEKRFENYSGIPVGIILGGNSGAVKYDDATISHLMEGLKRLPIKGHSYFLTASRRTPKPLIDAVKKTLSQHQLWHQELDGGENPYLEILAYCQRYIVTGDSHNMVSEALFTGRPCYVYRPKGLTKLNYFLDLLAKENAVRDFDGNIESFETSPIDASPQIAKAIKNIIKT